MIEKIKALCSIGIIQIVVGFILAALLLGIADAIWWDGGYGAWLGGLVESIGKKLGWL